MFDFSFSEIALIGVVALVVLGPERLPRVARTAGLLFGRMQRYVNTVKADISREIELDEIKRLHNEMQDAARSVETTIRTHVDDAQKAVSTFASETEQGVSSFANEARDALHGPVQTDPAAAHEAGALADHSAGAPDHAASHADHDPSPAELPRDPAPAGMPPGLVSAGGFATPDPAAQPVEAPVHDLPAMFRAAAGGSTSTPGPGHASVEGTHDHPVPEPETDPTHQVELDLGAIAGPPRPRP